MLFCKKYSFEKIVLTILFSFSVVCCISIIVFPQLRLLLLKFAGEKMLSAPMTTIIVSGIFLFILHCENIVFRFFEKRLIFIAYLVISIIALLIRISGFQFVSRDYRVFIIPWIEHLSENRHFFGIATIKSDYLPFYHYFMSIISFLPKYLWLPCVKAISCFFDFLLAAIIGKIVLYVCNSKLRALAAYSFVLLCPTVFFNSGIWAQCESIYAAFVFLSLLFFLKNKSALAFFFYGIAISIKLQAVFVLPFIVFLYFRRSFTFSKLFYFFAGIISTVVVGLPFGAHIQMIEAYFKQATGYAGSLTLNAPSIFSLFSANNDVKLFNGIGIIFTFAVLFGIFILLELFGNQRGSRTSLFIKKCVTRRLTIIQNRDAIMYITLFFFCSLIVPFFLPRMHERYFYLAEIASILYAVVIPKRWYISLLIILPSCVTYFNYLFGNGGRLLPLGLIVMTAVILVIKWTIQSIMNYEHKEQFTKQKPAKRYTRLSARRIGRR
jgi:Gpi18-like mannosyltransferase